MGDVTGSGDGLDAFWSSRPVLAHIRDYARSRRVGPWAVLGNVLVRAIASCPPSAVLPPLTGGYASLNLFVGIVGNPGDGKGAAERTAEEAVDFGDAFNVAGVGSGEGIAHQFMRRTKVGVDQHSTSVILSVPEIDTLTALTTGRRGSTLLPELRKAWMGEPLGFTYADPDKRLPVPAHEYRLCVVAGIQPWRAGPLLDDADAGAPQRFLWLPATDPNAPDTPPDQPPERWPWQPPVPARGRCVLDVPDIARTAVDAHRLAQLRQTGDDTLNGHSLLSWLKAAGALALLDSRTKITDEDWQLGGVVMAVSTRTREQVVAHLARARTKANTARGHAEADRAVITDEARHEHAVKRVCVTLRRKLADADAGQGEARNDLRKRVAARDRHMFDDAVARLIDAGTVERFDTDHGDRYRLTPKAPR